MHVKTALRTSTGKPVSFKSNITVTPVRARSVGTSSIDITPVFSCLTLIQIYKVNIHCNGPHSKKNALLNYSQNYVNKPIPKSLIMKPVKQNIQS